MAIGLGDRLPAGRFTRLGASGPAEVLSEAVFAGRKVALFAAPGAFTPTCSNAHVPSFVRAADALRGKGVDEILCVAVNDPFVLKAWGAATGATGAGIGMLSDAGGDFTRALGMTYDAPAAGLIGRSRRYAMLVDDGVVKALNLEGSPGGCGISAGEALLEAL